MESISLASFIHGLASETYAGRNSARSLLPTDLEGEIGKVMALVESGNAGRVLITMD